MLSKLKQHLTLTLLYLLLEKKVILKYLNRSKQRQRCPKVVIENIRKGPVLYTDKCLNPLCTAFFGETLSLAF